MAFFLPSSTPTSTTTSLSSSPLPVIRPLDSDDESKQSHDGNGSLRHRRSDDFPSTRSGFTMFGLLSRRIEYISGASASDISSLESSESEAESLWTRRATFGDDEDEFDDRHTNTRTSRSTRDARSPSWRRHSPDIHDPVVELSVGRTGPPTSEPNVASSTYQIEGEEETVKRRNRRHGSTEVDRSSARRVKLRNRRDSHVYEAFISRDFFLVIILCFGLACAWMVLARPIMMNWFGFYGSRSVDGYMYMEG